MHVAHAGIRSVLGGVLGGVFACAVWWSYSQWGLPALRWFLCGASTLAVLGVAKAWRDDVRTRQRRTDSGTARL